MSAIKEHVRQKSGSKLRISKKHFETALNKIKKKSGNRIADSPNLHGDDAIMTSSSLLLLHYNASADIVTVFRRVTSIVIAAQFHQ